jgi:ABC-type dipeptide/oligopeptide/nickel transport system ATPase component
MFKKAIKHEAKGRTAIIGPAGSGKSYTMLTLARKLAGPNGRIAAIDTEHGSLSKYADLFDFDVIELDSFAPDKFLSALQAAESAGYQVFCCDSLSHFWVGKGGALEFVDMAKKRSQSRDDMAGWKEFRPHERAMVDAMIASPCHVIVTMRTKTAYEEQVNERTGKKQRVKIGLAPVQREGMEYEFDLILSGDEENNFVIDKTRCPAYSGKVLTKPSAKDFDAFQDWLNGAAREQAPPPAPAQRAATPPSQTGPKPVPPPAADVPEEIQQLWVRMGTSRSTILAVFGELKKAFDELAGSDRPYYDVLAKHGAAHANDLKGVNQARQAAREMFEALQKMKVEPPLEETAPEAQEVAG